MSQENLGQELIDKAKECASIEEVMGLLQSEGYELSDELVEKISGGLGYAEMLECLASGDIVARRPYASNSVALGSSGRLVLGFADSKEILL